MGVGGGCGEEWLCGGVVPCACVLEYRNRERRKYIFIQGDNNEF